MTAILMDSDIPKVPLKLLFPAAVWVLPEPLASDAVSDHFVIALGAPRNGQNNSEAWQD